MADEIYDDIEQGERIKRWFKANGMAIVLGVGLGFAGIFGYQGYQQSQVERAGAVAERYRALRESINAEQLETATKQLESMVADFGNSGFAALARLQVAELATRSEQWDQARAALTELAEQSVMPELREIASLRLARLDLQVGEVEQALARLDKVGSPAMAGIRDHLRGDALTHLGRVEDARAAYTAALAALDEGKGNREFIESKLAVLGLKVGAAESPPEVLAPEAVAPEAIDPDSAEEAS